MATEAVETVETTPPWRRMGRGTVVPILLMLGLLFVLGQLHVDLAQGYTAPRLLADERGAYAFWDEGGREPTFCLREARDGAEWGPKQRTPGVLASAALGSDTLVGLYAGTDDAAWFYSIYQRKNLERVWNGTFEEPELGLVYPRHLASLGGEVLAFGTDKGGALHAARLGSTHRLVPIEEATLPGAAAAPPDPAAPQDARAAQPAQVAPPVTFASVPDQGGLVLLWRVLRDPTQGRQSPGELRWTRFDGHTFGPLARAPVDLAALALFRGAGFGSEEPRALLLGLAPGDREPRLQAWALGPEGFAALPETLDYPREGFAGQGGVAALAAAQVGPRLVVLAQIGGAIRCRTRAGGKWGEWEDFARLPAEQRAVVYGWFVAILTLCGALVVQGARGLRLRRQLRRAAAPAPAAPARGDAAGLLERALAFTTDGLLVLGLCGALPPFRQAMLEGAEGDPRLQLSLVVLLLVGLLTWLTAWEGLLRRTPGKWLLGLEVQDQDGGRPPASALVLRNLFRIELLLPPVWLAGLVTLAVMLVTPRHQRPGDLLARTVVVRREAVRRVEGQPA